MVILAINPAELVALLNSSYRYGVYAEAGLGSNAVVLEAFANLGGSNNAGQFLGNVLITGNFAVQGTKSAEVKLADGTPALMYCEEATAVYFVDYGEGKLVEGKAHITLDPEHLQTVTINAQNPMLVFVQVEGNCKGVYVTDKTATGFDVDELQGGTSNVSFAYRVVCKRKFFSSLHMSTPQAANVDSQHIMAKEWPEEITREQQKAARMRAIGKR